MVSMSDERERERERKNEDDDDDDARRERCLHGRGKKFCSQNWY
jgi:hypothetical protein